MGIFLQIAFGLFRIGIRFGISGYQFTAAENAQVIINSRTVNTAVAEEEINKMGIDITLSYFGQQADNIVTAVSVYNLIVHNIVHIPVVKQKPPEIAKRRAILGLGPVNLSSGMSSGVIFFAANISLSSGKVRTASITPATFSSLLSAFFAAQGPIKTTLA